MPADKRLRPTIRSRSIWKAATAGGLPVLSLILAVSMVWLISRSRCILYVVEVDKLGYALTGPQPLSPASVPDVTARMERYQIAAFVRNARSVTTDPQVEHQMLNSLLAHARGAADRFLDACYHSDGIFRVDDVMVLAPFKLGLFGRFARVKGIIERGVNPNLSVSVVIQRRTRFGYLRRGATVLEGVFATRTRLHGGEGGFEPPVSPKG